MRQLKNCAVEKNERLVKKGGNYRPHYAALFIKAFIL